MRRSCVSYRETLKPSTYSKNLPAPVRCQRGKKEGRREDKNHAADSVLSAVDSARYASRLCSCTERLLSRQNDHDRSGPKRRGNGRFPRARGGAVFTKIFTRESHYRA